MKASDVEGEWGDDGAVRTFRVLENECVLLWPRTPYGEIAISSYILLPDGREYGRTSEILGLEADAAKRLREDDDYMTAWAKSLYAETRTALDEELAKEKS